MALSPSAALQAQEVRVQASLDGQQWTLLVFTRSQSWDEVKADLREVLGLPHTADLDVRLSNGARFLRARDLRKDDKLVVSVAGAAQPAPAGATAAGGAAAPAEPQVVTEHVPDACVSESEAAAPAADDEADGPAQPQGAPAGQAAAPAKPKRRVAAAAPAPKRATRAAVRAERPTDAEVAAARASQPVNSILNLRTLKVYLKLRPAFGEATDGVTLLGRGVMNTTSARLDTHNVRLEGHSDGFTICTEVEQEWLTTSLLRVGANGVQVENVRFHAAAKFSATKNIQLAVVELMEKKVGFRMTRCHLRGDNLEVKVGERVDGTLGFFQNNDTEATLEDVEILAMNNAGVRVDLRATLHATRLNVHNNHGAGIFGNGCRKVTFTDCTRSGNGQSGGYFASLEPCEFRGTNTFKDSGHNGLFLGFPAEQIKKHCIEGPVFAKLFTTAHHAHGVELRRNHWCGVLVHGGVSVDLTDAVIEGSDRNGLRVEEIKGEETAAPITLSGARIQNNGRNRKSDANVDACFLCSLVVQQPRGKVGWCNRVDVRGATIDRQCDEHKGQAPPKEAMCIMRVDETSTYTQCVSHRCRTMSPATVA